MKNRNYFLIILFVFSLGAAAESKKTPCDDPLERSAAENAWVLEKAEARQVYLDRMQLIHVKEDRKAEYLASVAYKFQQLYCEAHNRFVRLKGGFEILPMDVVYYGEDAGKAKNQLVRKASNLSVFPVRYYNQEQKDIARIRFKAGKFFYGDGEPVIDIEVSYVMDENGEIFLGHPFWDDQIFDYNFRHSSLNNGEPVAAAGKIQFDKQGNIVSISRDSGHYLPEGKHLKQFIDRLKSFGVDLSHTHILDR